MQDDFVVEAGRPLGDAVDLVQAVGDAAGGRQLAPLERQDFAAQRQQAEPGTIALRIERADDAFRLDLQLDPRRRDLELDLPR